MKSIFLSIICAINGSLFAQDSDNLRILYLESIESELMCDSLLRSCKEIKSEEDPILSAYYSAGLIVKAKHLINPFKKLSLFTQGKEKLDSLIILNPNLTELRILRFTLQNSIPTFLGYNDFIDSDKQHIFDTPERIRQYETFFSLKNNSGKK
tara:strand:- start:667 stop:1125 length:459 start_codon:yes stop_codon:yes gene_type:complete